MRAAAEIDALPAFAPAVLVVDRGDASGLLVSAQLERRGWKVRRAASSAEALVASRATRFDVVLVETGSSATDGDALQRMARAQPAAALVAMTRQPTVELALAVMKHGANDLLVVPCSAEALASTMDAALAAARERMPAEPAAACVVDEMGIVGLSEAIANVRALVANAARLPSTVLVEGETGCGKEVVALAIHRQSDRARGPFVRVNCAAVPDHLLESELFGHERGAFTDARDRKIGLCEAARGGTLLLDEVGDLSSEGQAKLLRILETRTFRRVGGIEEIPCDVRIIAATNVELKRRVAEGAFRLDLFHRLDVVRITVPPLRARPEDVAPLAAHFLAHLNEALRRRVCGMDDAALAAMRAYAWPGNAREVRNVIERALVLHADIERIGVAHLPDHLRRLAPAEDELRRCSRRASALEDSEIRLIRAAMERAGGNQTHAARLLGISRYILRYRLRKFALV